MQSLRNRIGGNRVKHKATILVKQGFSVLPSSSVRYEFACSTVVVVK
jgi:hypothetical protein